MWEKWYKEETPLDLHCSRPDGRRSSRQGPRARAGAEIQIITAINVEKGTKRKHLRTHIAVDRMVYVAAGRGQGPELVLIQISILRIIRPLHRQTYLHGSPVSSRKKGEKDVMMKIMKK